MVKKGDFKDGIREKIMMMRYKEFREEIAGKPLKGSGTSLYGQRDQSKQT